MDILSKLAKQSCCEALGKPKKFRFFQRYQIVYSGRASKKLYEYAKARKLVSRAKRMGLDCYMSPIQVRLEVK